MDSNPWLQVTRNLYQVCWSKILSRLPSMATLLCGLDLAQDLSFVSAAVSLKTMTYNGSGLVNAVWFRAEQLQVLRRQFPQGIPQILEGIHHHVMLLFHWGLLVAS